MQSKVSTDNDYDDGEEEEEDTECTIILPLQPQEKPENDLLLVACGWFWTSQLKFQRIDGVITVIAGYFGGIGGSSHPYQQQEPSSSLLSPTPTPTYNDILDYAESLWIEYDPKLVTCEELLHAWTKMHNPTKPSNQYRSCI